MTNANWMQASHTKENMQEPENNEFSITNRDVIGLHWKVIVLMAAAILFLATYSVNSVINSPHDRIDALVGEIVHVHKELDDLKYEVAQTQRNDLECERRNDRQQADLDMLKNMGSQCVNWRAKAEVEISQLKQIYDWYLKIKRLPD